MAAVEQPHRIPGISTALQGISNVPLHLSLPPLLSLCESPPYCHIILHLRPLAQHARVERKICANIYLITRCGYQNAHEYARWLCAMFCIIYIKFRYAFGHLIESITTCSCCGREHPIIAGIKWYHVATKFVKEAQHFSVYLSDFKEYSDYYRIKVWIGLSCSRYVRFVYW